MSGRRRGTLSPMPGTPLSLLSDASDALAATQSKNAKRDRLAQVLASVDDDVREPAIAFLSGELLQGKIGVGWAAVRDLEVGSPAATPSLSVREVHDTFGAIALARGAGSAKERTRLLGELFERATERERAFLGRLVVGELRQGALDASLLDAIAAVTRIAPEAVRRAAMLAGSIVVVGAALMRDGPAALERWPLTPFRPISPMLASPGGDLEEALSALASGPAVIERKLDGARLQAHKDGEDVCLYTRSLHDVTARGPEIVARVRAMPARRLILDGEALALDGASGRPLPFQKTMSRFGRRAPSADGARPLSGFFFDVVLVDDTVLLDLPLEERTRALTACVPSGERVPRIVTEDLEEAERFYAESVAQGHEGVMAKSLRAPYEAGRRGAAWLKIKPAHTLDLVVLAVERGSGRRSAWLSNLHLGARDPTHGGWVMLGKTFKGMTDAMLTWQTEHLRALAVGEEEGGYVVHVRPELVVEIAFDGVQESTHYPGGLALRFARVKRYRADKPAREADTIDAVRAIFERSRGA